MFTEMSYLNDWLMKYYIEKCTERFWRSDGLSSDTKLKRIMNSLHSFMPSYSQHRSLSAIRSATYFICECNQQSQSVLDVSTVNKWCEEIGGIDRRLLPVITAMSILSQTATNDVTSTRVINLLSAILTQFDRTVMNIESETSAARCMLNRAIRLMQLSVKQSPGDRTTNTVLVILSILYLRRTIHVADCDEIHCLTQIYLAVLYYIAGHYQSVIRYCKRVTTMHRSTLVIDITCLPKIYCDIDTVGALSALYYHLQLKARSSSSLSPHQNVFTAQLLAHYFMFLAHGDSISSNSKLQNVLLRQYASDLINTPTMLSTDFLLFYILVRKRSRLDEDTSCTKTPATPSKFSISELRRLLVMTSVEQLTVFRRIISCEFSSVCRIVTSDMEAIHAYKCGNYEKCLQMSQENVKSLWQHTTTVFEIPTFGCMTQLMSDDIALLTAIDVLNGSFCDKVNSQMILSIYLIIETKLKLKHPMTSIVDELHRVIQLSHRLPTAGIKDCLLLSFIYRKAMKNLVASQARK
jgi:hypothetical protein